MIRSTSYMCKQEHTEQIRRDYLNGMTYKEIAKKYYIDQRTAKRYADHNLPLSELEHRSYPSILDPYEPFIRSILQTGPVFAKTIYKALRENGYNGSYTLVNRRVQQIIRENEAAGLYPPDVPRSKNISTKSISITERIRKENEYAARRT